VSWGIDLFLECHSRVHQRACSLGLVLAILFIEAYGQGLCMLMDSLFGIYLSSVCFGLPLFNGLSFSLRYIVGRTVGPPSVRLHSCYRPDLLLWSVVPDGSLYPFPISYLIESRAFIGLSLGVHRYEGFRHRVAFLFLFILFFLGQLLTRT